MYLKKLDYQLALNLLGYEFMSLKFHMKFKHEFAPSNVFHEGTIEAKLLTTLNATHPLSLFLF